MFSFPWINLQQAFTGTTLPWLASVDPSDFETPNVAISATSCIMKPARINDTSRINGIWRINEICTWLGHVRAVPSDNADNPGPGRHTPRAHNQCNNTLRETMASALTDHSLDMRHRWVHYSTWQLSDMVMVQTTTPRTVLSECLW